MAEVRLGDVMKERREAAEILNPKDQGKLTFEQASAVFFERLKGDGKVKPRTVDYYQQRNKALLKSWPDLGAKDLRHVTTEQCAKWGARFGKDASATAYNHTLGYLKRVFEIGVELGTRYGNPASGLKRKREKLSQPKLPSGDQFAAIVAAVDGAGKSHCRESADFVRFLAFGGMRQMEAVNVTWGDCNFEKGSIHVRGDAATGTKNSETRHVPMIPEMKALLEKMKGQKPEAQGEDRLFGIVSVKKSLATACEKTGAARITHHDLRHLFATRCIEAGVDIPTVSRWLGHKDGGALAMRVYGHLRDDHSKSMAAKVSFGNGGGHAA